MKLKSFSSVGILHFEFNIPFIVPSNLTFIDETVLNITINTLPTDDRQFFNFTWNVTKYTKDFMDLQIFFHDAYYISADHKMTVKVKETYFFVSNDQMKTISDSNREMSIRCLPQIQLGEASAKIMKASVDNTNKSAKGMLAGNVAINLLMSSALNFVWGMINGLQILAIMPLVDCQMPGNA